MTRWCKRGRHDICQRETEDETGLLVFDCECYCHGRECNFGACDPLDHGDLEKSLRGKIHNLPSITGYRHVPPCPKAARNG